MKIPRADRKEKKSAGIGYLKLLFIDSQVGRRLVAMFLVAALFPACVMGLALFVRVGDVLKTSQDAEISQAVRSYGSLVLERLSRVDAMLRSAESRETEQTLARSAYGRSIGGELKGVAVLARDGTLLESNGKMPGASVLQPLADATGFAKARIRTLRDDKETTVLVARRVATADREEVIVASVDPAFLWAGPSSISAVSEFCVATRAGSYLFCTDPTSTLDAPLFGARRGGEAREVRWTRKDEPMLASSQALRLKMK